MRREIKWMKREKWKMRGIGTILLENLIRGNR